MSIDTSITLSNSPFAATEARQWISEQMLALNRTKDVDTALLLVAELVTNAILHAPGERPVLKLYGTHCIAVHDGSAARPVLRPPSADSESGRGMMLVAELSAVWGVDEGGVYPDGKMVWCCLPRTEQCPAT